MILPVPSDAPEPPKAHVKRGVPESRWTYRGCDRRACSGYVLPLPHQRRRQGRDAAGVREGRQDRGAKQWRWLSFPIPRPLYGLDRLAANPDATVLIVEGEKCADAACCVVREALRGGDVARWHERRGAKSIGSRCAGAT